MSIDIRCRKCGAEYGVSDDMAGRTIRCKECDARVDVPDDDELDRPRRSKKRPQRSDNTAMILLIVGGVLCVGCVVCSGIGIVGYWTATKVGNAVAEDLKQMNAGLVPPGVGKIILSQQAVLMPNDPLRDGHPTKTFTIKVQQGKTYVVDMQTTQFDMDPYLLIFDPANIKIAEDDDSGGGMNNLDARIRFTANRTGTYTIGCTVWRQVPAGGGRFTVTVREE